MIFLAADLAVASLAFFCLHLFPNLLYESILSVRELRRPANLRLAGGWLFVGIELPAPDWSDFLRHWSMCWLLNTAFGAR